ncbi:MerR family transcriptional regulator [Rhodopseudomonas sp. HC1]|uniref:MerR family transcriptional regulator n=1 Tax=Rhodopseudomonas infernalis TaxID=2897386 RepID=UPI001EE7DE99|nr:MerR family transcriptional regulator [Rhodopseudomonas infernalis]MCG6205052.1 MerR family transcriptional regulator [Rhodopseudomonas infernalis]
MKIGDLARRTGLTAHTLRYYERIGLLPRAPRDASGQRDYDVSILVWIEFLGRLKTTGMPIRDMLRYAKLRARGAATEDARRVLLQQHRNKVQAHVAELLACLTVLDTKIAGYAAGASKVETDNDATPIRPARKVRARPARALGD